MIKITKPQKQALAITTVLAVIGCAFFLKHYFLLIALSAIAAFTFNPLYQRFLKRGQSPSRAAMTTLACSFIIIIIPVGLVLLLTIHQAIGLVDSIKHLSQNLDLQRVAQDAVDSCNRFLATLHIPYQLSLTTITQQLASVVKTFATNLLSGIGSSITGIAGLVSSAIIFIYVFMSMLIKQDKIFEIVHVINPLGKEISLLYESRMATMAKAMVKGQFVIATAQGFTDALLLYLAGMHAAFFFYFLLLTMLSIIPLGGGIIVIPIGIIMILLGDFWQGALVLAGHFLIVTNIDNVLRPRLVPKQARLDPALTLLAVFSGLYYFGFLGIVIGPVIMILIVTTLQVFMEVFKEVKSVDTSEIVKRTPGAFHKLVFWRNKPEPERQRKLG